MTQQRVRVPALRGRTLPAPSSGAATHTEAGAAGDAPAVRAGFEGALGQRRLSQWNPTSRTLDSILAGQGGALVRRTRDLSRNNALARSIQESFAANLVGTGVKPSSMVKDAALRERLNAAWVRSLDEIDADGIQDFYGQQLTAANELFEAGEVFGLLIERDRTWGLNVPLQIRLIQAEQCPRHLSRSLPGGASIRQGIEFDTQSRRVAYWFYRSHPGEESFAPNVGEMIRVRAEDVIHVFERRNAGQARGVPRFAPSMVRAYNVDLYDDFEVERKKQAAAASGWITRPLADDPAQKPASDDPGASTLVLSSGMLNVLDPGEQISFGEAADVGGNYDAFEFHNNTMICAGAGVPYAAGTGDLRRTSYGSQRAALVEMRRRMEPILWATVVHQLGRPFHLRWFRTAVLVGAFALPGGSTDWRRYAVVKWIPQPWAWIDPLKDRKAEVLAVRAGFKSRADVVEAEGEDVEVVDERIRADRERERKLGLSFPELQDKPAQAKPRSSAATQAGEAEPAPGQDDQDADKEAA